MSFGYSVGDAFTAIAVITKIVRILHDIHESRSEYQHLVDDLDNLKLVDELCGRRCCSLS